MPNLELDHMWIGGVKMLPVINCRWLFMQEMRFVCFSVSQTLHEIA